MKLFTNTNVPKSYYMKKKKLQREKLSIKKFILILNLNNSAFRMLFMYYIAFILRYYKYFLSYVIYK